MLPSLAINDFHREPRRHRSCFSQQFQGSFVRWSCLANFDLSRGGIPSLRLRNPRGIELQIVGGTWIGFEAFRGWRGDRKSSGGHALALSRSRGSTRHTPEGNMSVAGTRRLYRAGLVAVLVTALCVLTLLDSPPQLPDPPADPPPTPGKQFSLLPALLRLQQRATLALSLSLNGSQLVPTNAPLPPNNASFLFFFSFLPSFLPFFLLSFFLSFFLLS